jgi:ubiquinone/menaquinone biosynthesis C-methylase UbiE
MSEQRSGEPAGSGESAAIGSYFDAEALEYVREREQQVSFQSQKHLVLDMLQGVSGRALDIGCGPAMMEEALLERGFEVWGIDASPQMIEYGNQRMAGHRMGTRCHLALGDAERLAWPENTFDAVISMGVLEYLSSYDRMIGEISRTLRPGGIAVLTVPNRLSSYRLAASLYYTVRETARRVAGQAPAASRTPPTRPCVPWQLDSQLERAGLRKIEGRFCNFIFFPLLELHREASEALNRRLAPLSSAPAPLGAALGSQYVVKVQKR